MREHLSGEPATVFAEQLRLTPEPFGRVPHTYIETLRDAALPVEHQRAIQTQPPCDDMFTLDTNHLPFFSAPVAFAQVLQDIAGR